MAVDLVPALLAALDNPFAPVDLDRAQPAMGTTTAVPCCTDGEPLVTSNTPATAVGASIAAPATANASGRQLVGAPWGTVCLTVLVQRCSDKAAIVRARALQNLAVVATGFTSFHGGSSAEEARFLAALASAHEVNLQPQPMLGCTPGPMSPPLVSPAGTSEPGEVLGLLEKKFFQGADQSFCCHIGCHCG